ncbi:hypothetical protein K504DRAFT_460698 [Pleomassaria siparia CBS 279.74]|uniref:RING-type domain-containing protein n=1 Tax=Pleomassaria siparia CBS 279.74 TaxID=1314801 RepID=A0A6G1JXK4_9PLEO|nr:hypothetical protein K504DRAFT_460698 [Pleomassaria siparia CBS 279.74]
MILKFKYSSPPQRSQTWISLQKPFNAFGATKMSPLSAEEIAAREEEDRASVEEEAKIKSQEERKLRARYRVMKLKEHLKGSDEDSLLLCAESSTPVTLATTTTALPLPKWKNKHSNLFPLASSHRTNTAFEREKKDSVIAPTPPFLPLIPRLKKDFLFHQLTPILNADPNHPAHCYICQTNILKSNVPMEEAAWRVVGCGHQMHVQCLRDFDWVQQNTSRCPKFMLFVQLGFRIGAENMRARVGRMEERLLPWLGNLKDPGMTRGEGRCYVTVESDEEEYKVWVKEEWNRTMLGDGQD